MSKKRNKLRFRCPICPNARIVYFGADTPKELVCGRCGARLKLAVSKYEARRNEIALQEMNNAKV